MDDLLASSSAGSQSPDREAGGNVFCLCRKVCQISSVSLTGTRTFLKESAAKAQSKPRTKEGLKSKKFNSTSCNTARPFCRALQKCRRENNEAARRITRPTSHWNSSYNLQTQLTLGATDAGQLGLRVPARRRAHGHGSPRVSSAVSYPRRFLPQGSGQSRGPGQPHARADRQRAGSGGRTQRTRACQRPKTKLAGLASPPPAAFNSSPPGLQPRRCAPGQEV